MRSDRPSADTPLRIAPVLVLVASLTVGACVSTMSEPRAPDRAGQVSPNWSSSAARTQDDAWHFAYAVQSWAAEQSGHVVMIPARHSIVVDRGFFSNEFSHIPLRALRGVRAEDPNQVVVLKHLWTTHASSWDYDTDIKFVLYGPGFVKEGVRLEKTTLQNVAPTYARLIGTHAPRGSMGRVMTEALVPTSKKPKIILTVVMDGGGRSLYDAWPDAWPVIKGLAARGVEYTDAKVTQLETATAVSHVAIGTGGYPFTTRIVGNEIAAYLRSLTARDYYGPREKWPAYLADRPDERLFFNAYTFEQVEAFVKANPRRWMANPYAGDGTAVTLEHDLRRLHATGTDIGYLAYGTHADQTGARIEDTRYFYRDGGELTEEHEAFQELTRE